MFFFFKQKTAYEMRISDWSSDVCSSDLPVKLAADAAEMRGKIAAHKPPKGALDIKGGPGGLVDLEFAMQVTQLVSGRCHDPNISAALACMKAAELVPPEVIDAHGLLARMLVMLDRKSTRLNSSH